MKKIFILFFAATVMATFTQFAKAEFPPFGGGGGSTKSKKNNMGVGYNNNMVPYDETQDKRLETQAELGKCQAEVKKHKAKSVKFDAVSKIVKSDVEKAKNDIKTHAPDKLKELDEWLAGKEVIYVDKEAYGEYYEKRVYVHFYYTFKAYSKGAVIEKKIEISRSHSAATGPY